MFIISRSQFNEVKINILINLVNNEEDYSLVGVAFWRGVGVYLRFCQHIVAFCLLLGVALQLRPGAELRVSSLFFQFMCAPLHVVTVLLCVAVGASSVFGVFQCFSHPPLPLFHYFVYYYVSLLLFIVYYYYFPLSSWLFVTGAWVGAGFGSIFFCRNPARPRPGENTEEYCQFMQHILVVITCAYMCTPYEKDNKSMAFTVI